MPMVRTADGDPEATGSISVKHPDGTEEKLGDFKLEPSEPGIVPQRVIDELRRCYREAKDYTGALSEAIKAQAEKHEVEPAALRKYIAALESDDMDGARKEVDDLQRLLESATA
jgi:hypothetical protein